jgi:micrococcal nuclease
MPARQYRYCVDSVRAVDGDTVELVINLGFDLTRKVSVRCSGVNTPESRGAEKEAGLLVKEYTRKWLEKRLPEGLMLMSKELDKFGRVLGFLERDGGNLSADLLAAELALPYDGGKRDPLTPKQIATFVVAAKKALAEF